MGSFRDMFTQRVCVAVLAGVVPHRKVVLRVEIKSENAQQIAQSLISCIREHFFLFGQVIVSVSQRRQQKSQHQPRSYQA